MSKRPMEVRPTDALVLRTEPVAIQDGFVSTRAAWSVGLSGHYVMPGIIDLQDDAFERHIAPRPSAPLPLRQGLIATDREVAANGVTTARLAQSWSREGGRRGPQRSRPGPRRPIARPINTWPLCAGPESGRNRCQATCGAWPGNSTGWA